jgi:hypothetical protein
MPSTPDPIAPGAAGQLTNLLLAVATAAAVAALLGGALAVRRRLRGQRSGPAPPAPAADPGGAGARLLGGVLLLVLALPAAVAVRQLWPHPDLGWRLLVIWLVALLPPAVAWLVLLAHRRPPGGSP